MKNINLQVVNDVPFPHLGDSDEDYVLSHFLNDSEGYSDLFDRKIKEASENDDTPIEFSTNSVGIDFYKDRVVLEHLYPEDEDYPLKAEVAPAELKELMKTWERMLSEWKQNNRGN